MRSRSRRRRRSIVCGSPACALEYIERTEKLCMNMRAYTSTTDSRIVTGGGRMTITMDRYEADWAMVERGWHTHVLGEGRRFASASEAVRILRDEHPGI